MRFGGVLDFLKAPQPVRERRPRNAVWVGADVMPGSEEYLQLGGRELALQQATLRLPETFMALQNVAKLCAQHNPHVGRQPGPDEKPEPQKDHPFERVLWRPNKWMSDTFIFWFTYMALPARGEAYLYIEDGGDPKGNVLEIWPMPPWRVKSIPTNDSRTFVEGYNYWPEAGGKPITMPAENVCWIRQPNLHDLYSGCSNTTPAEQAIQTAHNQWLYRNNYYGKRRARPEVLIGAKKDMSLAEFQRLQQELFAQFQVVDRGTLVHRMGDLDVKVLGMSAEEMQLMQFQDHDAKVLESLFGWNSSLGQATSYAHADVSWEIVAQMAWPLMKLVANDLARQVLQPRYGDDLVLYYEDIRPKRRDTDRADYQVYGLDQTINELRESRGDPPITIGPMAKVCDTIPTRLLPFHFQNAQQQAPAQPALAAAPAPGPVEPEETKSDLERWQRKALRVLGESGTAAAEFESDHIPESVANGIRGALMYAATPDEVKGIFQCALTPYLSTLS